MSPNAYSEPGGPALNPGQPELPASPIDPRECIQALRDKWWVLVLLALLGATGGYYYTGKLQAKYSAKAVLQVAEEERLVSIEDVIPQDLRANEALNTIVANIKNSSVMLRVARANALTNAPMFIPGLTKPVTEETAARLLEGMITCKLRKDTRLIDIIVTHPSANMARKLANSVAQEFISHNLDQRYSTTQAANQLLFEEAARLKTKLEESERRLQAYKEEHNVLSVDDHQNAVGDRLASLNKSLSDAKAARLQAEADWRQMQSLSNHVEALLRLPAVLNDATVEGVRQKVVDLEASVQTLSQRYKPKYPAMATAQRQLQDLRESLTNLVLAIPATSQATYQGALAREQTLEQALLGVQQEALAQAKAGIQFHVLEREVESDRALYDAVLRRLKETDVTKGLEKHSIAMVEPANRTTKEAVTSRRALAAMGAMGGLGAAAVLLILLRLLDSSLRSVDVAEQTLGLPVVASVPLLSQAERKCLPMVVDHSDSAGAEAFRTLRVATNTANASLRGCAHLFTSALPGEGKSFSSLNYALCLAHEGRKTLVMDLDLRQPTLGRALRAPAQAPGVQEFLMGQTNLEALLQPTSYPNLWLMTAGNTETESARLLTRESCKELLDLAGTRFDRIVIDSAPINCVGDTLLILPLVSLSFLVVRAGKTPRRAVRRAIELMARSHQAPNGIILNFMPSRLGFGYYYSYSEGYYGTKNKELAGDSTQS